MKHLFTIMLLMALATAAHSQEPNHQLRQLEQYMQEQDFSVSHIQTSAIEQGITHQWQALLNAYIIHPQSSIDSTKSAAENLRMIHIYDSINHLRRQAVVGGLDSIRLTFARLGKDASESYLYEYHKNGIDTIKYSLAFRRDSDTLLSSRYGNKIYFSNASEVASFDYTRYNDSDGWGATDWGNYYHQYTIPNNISHDDMRPFDHNAFETLIAPALKTVRKLKGVKAYPVYWRHDEGFDDNVGTKGTLTSKTTRQSDHTNKHYGLTTGTCYFIPRKHEEEAKALYKQLDSLAHNYVDSHPEQYYRYSFSEGFSNGNLRSILQGLNLDDDSNYDLKTLASNDGFYILSINTKGELWVPRDWPKLKSYINGQLTYRKGTRN
nr:hypothetical protein [Prevotella sp.]